MAIEVTCRIGDGAERPGELPDAKQVAGQAWLESIDWRGNGDPAWPAEVKFIGAGPLVLLQGGG